MSKTFREIIARIIDSNLSGNKMNKIIELETPEDKRNNKNKK